MHAYLVVGQDKELVYEKALKRAREAGKVMEFPVSKISDVRELRKFVKLKFQKPTALIIENVDQATNEAMSAFLKILEEPQKNLNFVLTSASEYKVLPTISSRCQVIRVYGKGNNDTKHASDFLTQSKSEKFKAIANLRKREETEDFLKTTIFELHSLLVKGEGSKKKTAQALSHANETLRAIEANANVGLQLTNFVIKIDNFKLT